VGLTNTHPPSASLPQYCTTFSTNTIGLQRQTPKVLIVHQIAILLQ
jgi:hypothetical protein